MAGVIGGVFGTIIALATDVFISGFFILIILVRYNFVELGPKAMVFITALFYGLVIALTTTKVIRRRRREMREGLETERTLVLTYLDIFMVELFAFIAAAGILTLGYFMKKEITLVSVFQSLFVLLSVKFVNWYYMKKRV